MAIQIHYCTYGLKVIVFARTVNQSTTNKVITSFFQMDNLVAKHVAYY